MSADLQSSGEPAVPSLADPRALASVFDYDVECDWYLLWTCNYRCRYCFFSPEILGSKIKTFGTPEQWRAAFDATGKRWLIHMTGGEPTVYPDFLAICEALTERHVISLNSNLSRPVIRMMAGRVDPRRVSFINAGLHLGERVRHQGFDDFLSNAAFLQDAGFRVFVTVVATPKVIANLPELTAICADRGLQLAPKIVRGSHNGQMYPRDYTPREKDRLRNFIARARERYLRVYEGWPRPSIDILSDDELLDGLPNFRGRSCGAGARFVRVQEDGEVHRCDDNRPSMGNLLTGTLRFAPGPAPCDTQYCVYFCKKYAAAASQPARRPARTA